MKLKTLQNILLAPFKSYNDWTREWENESNYMNTLQTIPENPISGWNIAISQVKPKSKVLSVGCGAGREVKFLVNVLKCNVTAIDHSDEMIRLSKKNEPKARYITGDAIKYKSLQKFDHILCLWNTMNCLPGINSRKELVRNSYSNLKSGGTLIIGTVPREGSWRTFLLSLLYINKDYYFGKSQINKWFKGTNFKIYRTRINTEYLILCKK